MNVYSKCTNCYNELTKEEITKAAEEKNLYFPLCDKCMDEFINAISKKLNKN